MVIVTFIEVNTGSEVLLVNLANIDIIRRRGTKSSEILFVSGRVMTVDETYEELIKKIPNG